MANSKTSDPEIGELEAAIELRRRRLARNDVLAFTRYTMPDYQVNPHHEMLCQYLNSFVRGDIKRLMVFMPPRNGKSELVSRRLPSYILGRRPDASIISCSYSSDLSSRMNRDVQRIIDSPPYATLFPETQLFGKNIRTTADGAYLRNSDIFEIVGHKGVYRSAGVGGGITGMGCHYGIIDDPIKNQEEAQSVTYREGAWEWYKAAFYTRLEKDAQILLTMTRWHEDDLAGKILTEMENEGEKWTVINFPAIAEEDDILGRRVGDPLWPDKFPPNTLATIRKTVGPYVWTALYQGRPAPPEGELLKKSWWKFYNFNPHTNANNFHEIAQSWDLSFKDTKGSARVSGQVWGRIDANCYLLDEVTELMDFPATIKAIRTLTGKWPTALKKYVEDKANGPAVISVLKNKIPGLIPVEPEGGKVARAYAITGILEAGNVYLPAPEHTPWVHDFIQECSSFPRGKYADRVDAMSQALVKWVMVVTRNTGNEPRVDEAVTAGTNGDDESGFSFDDELGDIW